ncbi:MAG TPA: electron transfer flavoprotein subunit alpha/FixB family protein [Candidatus Krumholzibacteria bacterium]|nr:electron transfer flavoprotein subunit alpha/FixB family protein [Candidatus Krumholzibacteria bacterium]HRX51168.1 electron transfer flavoprotein subunit alpha/FixB family protein [Candidatus Krumholzibacteria bacterium]
MPNIAVFIEQRDGAVKKVAWQMISKARALCDAAGGEVWAVLLGEADAAPAGAHGAHKVFQAKGDAFAAYNSEGWSRALAAFCTANSPDLLLLGATAMGKDLAPRLAARLDAACVSDSVDLSWDGGFVIRRPMFAGKCYADVKVASATAVVGVRPNAFALNAGDGAAAAVEAFDPGLDGFTPKASVVETKQAGGKTVELTEAEIVVSGGRGLKEADNYQLIRDLAQTMGAAAGASRAIVDAGWVPHSHQVGQTGKTVSPNLYVAIGISGAIQHLAGMSSSKCIVAINKDPNAPIFKAADYGIVADLFDVVGPFREALAALD